MTKLLIVEDEDIVARMYQKALTYDGFDVQIAIGGNEGLKKAVDFKPDLILLDIMMPGMDGIEVLEKLKQNDASKNIPTVLLTNLSGSYDEKYGVSKGAAGYWVKTEVKTNELGEKIRNLLNVKTN